MKEELRKLWKEYEKECEDKTESTTYWYRSSIDGFWHWVLTGEINN